MTYGDMNSCQETKREGVRAYTCGRPITAGSRCDECQAEHDGAPAVIARLRQRIWDLEAFLREHGSVIAWCPGHHSKLVRDLLELKVPGVDEDSLRRSITG